MSPGNRPEYLRASQIVRDTLPISEATLWRWVRKGKFPKPVKLSERVTAWRAEDVRAWLDKQQAAA